MEEARREEAADTKLIVGRKIPERQQDKQETQNKKQKFKSHSKKSLSIALYGLRIFVQNGCFTNWSLGPCFIALSTALSPALGDISLSLPGRTSDANIWQVTLPTAHTAKHHSRSTKNYCCTSNQVSPMPVVGTEQRLEKSEFWGINSLIFLQEIFAWQSNLPMRLQVGNKPEKHQHLGILAVLV